MILLNLSVLDLTTTITVYLVYLFERGGEDGETGKRKPSSSLCQTVRDMFVPRRVKTACNVNSSWSETECVVARRAVTSGVITPISRVITPATRL